MTTLFQLLQTLSDYTLSSDSDPATIEVNSVVADSRAVEPGALFVAIQGRATDGHRYLTTAVQRGATALLGSRSYADLTATGIKIPTAIPYVQVTDSRLALAHCCAALYAFPSQAMTVLGVTGTDGKTTTSSLLESILTAATQTAANAAGSVGVITTVGARIRGTARETGAHVTTPDAPEVQRFLAAMRDAGCQYAIVESTSHGLDQERVAAVAFDVAAVTNITHEHLDYHGTREAYVAAKAKLFRALFHTPPKPGIPRTAVLNADDAGSIDALQAVLDEETTHTGQSVTVRRYSMAAQPVDQPPPDVLATDLVYAPDRTRFTLRWWGGEFAVTSPLIGDFNVANVLCAATATLALGIDPAAVGQGIAAFPGVTGRMQRIDRGQPFLALVDFAHTPGSLERALLTLRALRSQIDQGGRIIAVFGSAGLRDRAKRYLMGEVSGRLADFTVITAEDPRTEDLAAINAEIARGVRQHADERAFIIIPDRGEAIQHAVELAQPGDIVAAFGKGHEPTMCYGTVEYPWSDQAVLAQALVRRMTGK